MNKEKAKEFWDEYGYDIEGCTCNDCDQKDKCKYAYDLYNTSGDCLAMK